MLNLSYCHQSHSVKSCYARRVYDMQFLHGPFCASSASMSSKLLTNSFAENCPLIQKALKIIVCVADSAIHNYSRWTLTFLLDKPNPLVISVRFVFTVHMYSRRCSLHLKINEVILPGIRYFENILLMLLLLNWQKAMKVVSEPIDIKLWTDSIFFISGLFF